MNTVVGVFASYPAARQAVRRLAELLPPDRINLLTPGTPEDIVESVPTTKDMPPVGKVIGGALGTAVGLGTGAALFLTGIGAVTVLGVAATGLLGLGGGLLGSKAGEAADEASSEGLPVDELYFYEDALRKGRSVVIVTLEGTEKRDEVKQILSETGAESLDAARESWWVGLRDDEELEYTAAGGDFKRDEPDYRRGYEAALMPHCRGKSYYEALDDLRRRFPGIAESAAFRVGYERSHARLQEAQPAEARG
jgi:hypothetical protein